MRRPYAGLTARESVVAMAPQRAHVHATCSGSSFMTTGHRQSCGGHGLAGRLAPGTWSVTAFIVGDLLSRYERDGLL